MKRNFRRRYFTLIELISAAAIMAMIAVTIGLMLNTVYRSWRRLSSASRLQATSESPLKNFALRMS